MINRNLQQIYNQQNIIFDFIHFQVLENDSMARVHLSIIARFIWLTTKIKRFYII